MLKLKYKLMESDYIDPSGISYAVIATPMGSFAGVSTLLEEDKDNKSSFFGCQIAEYKAFIKYANKQIFVQKEKVKMLKQTYKEMSEIYNFNVKSREAVFLRKKIEREENTLKIMQQDREAVVFAMQQLIVNRDKTLTSLKDRKEKND